MGCIMPVEDPGRAALVMQQRNAVETMAEPHGAAQVRTIVGLSIISVEAHFGG